LGDSGLGRARDAYRFYNSGGMGFEFLFSACIYQRRLLPVSGRLIMALLLGPHMCKDYEVISGGILRERER